MAKRKRVGLIYSYNENWVAGSYYIINIVHALVSIDDDLKPEIVLLTDSKENFEKVKLETRYPYLTCCIIPFRPKYSNFEKGINRISKWLLSKKIINKKPDFPKLDFVYPKEIIDFPGNLKKVNWIPDFQEEHLPEFFSQEQIRDRKEYQKNVLVKSDIIVFSSFDSKKDFEKLYPNSSANLFVLPFAVTHPDYSNHNIDELLKKYDLPKSYFLTPNQFWAHKNHMIVLKAVKKLNDKGLKVVVAFTGKESDHRNVKIFKKLKKYITTNNLTENIRFLGFIDRTEQLCLMDNAIAIIQPSLFEGWSTVVEDAKALNKFLILSDLDIHREQISENVTFFDPYSHLELSKALEKISKVKPKIVKMDYKLNVAEFGNNFLKLVGHST